MFDGINAVSGCGAKSTISLRSVGGLLLAWSLLFAAPAQAQLIVTYESIIFSVRADRGELRESMRREHRERVERAMAGRPDRVQRTNESTESMQRDEEILRDQRDAELAARRARWQRMSPDERQQLRRDIDQAGRNFYQSPPHRGGP